MSTSRSEIRKESEEKKKSPVEYTASQEDLLIGGSLSPSVVELRPNPSLRLNETVEIPRDGPRQHLLEWVGRMRSKGKGEESIQGLLPLSILPGVILTKAGTQADHVCCDH